MSNVTVEAQNYTCFNLTDNDTYDASIVGIGIESSEGGDRGNLSYHKPAYDAMNYMNSTLKHAGRKVLHVVAPGPVLLNDLADKADAVLFSVMPGENMGQALVNVLFNVTVPNGKLTFTIPNRENE